MFGPIAIGKAVLGAGFPKQLSPPQHPPSRSGFSGDPPMALVPRCSSVLFCYSIATTSCKYFRRLPPPAGDRWAKAQAIYNTFLARMLQ